MSYDRIANMISALKNSSMAGRGVVEVPYTKQCEDVAKVLEKGGFLEKIKVFKQEKSYKKMLHLELMSENGLFKLSEVKRVSKLGRRIYRGYKELRPVLGGFGILVVSTSRGVMSGDEARKKKLGGEVLCEVY